MFEEHPLFTIPEDPNTTIWRYMDFAKFVSILERKALFFPRAIALDDPFEGSVSNPTATMRWESLKLPALDKAVFEATFKDLRKFMLLSCWNISYGESATLWKLYAPDRQGIALRSSIAHLKGSFKPHPEPVYIGQVQYIDYETEHMSEPNNIFSPFRYKRIAFREERELRAFIFRPRGIKSNEQGEKSLDLSGEVNRGEYVSVDGGLLVDEVVVSGTSEEWFLKLVEATIRRYGLDKPCRKSDLAREPIF